MPSREWAGFLDPGEHIVWQGRPSGRLVFRPSDLFQSLFGLFFFGFSIFWITMASSMSGAGGGGMSWVFPLFGLPFVVVGFYMLAGRYLWDVWVRRNTFYSLTTKRAFIATQMFGRRTLKSYPIDPDTPLELAIEGSEQTIWFSERWVRGNKGGRRRIRVGFELLSDGPAAYAAIRKVQESVE